MQYLNSGFVPAGATKILVLVNETKFTEPQGIWLSPYCEGVNQYKSFVELVMSIDDFYTQHNFLQQAMQPRRFGKEKQGNNTQRLETIRYMTDNLFTDVMAEKSTFIIQVLFRQNATWQGKVKWIEGGEEKNFRSTLELMKLMDEAITSSAQQKQEDEKAN